MNKNQEVDEMMQKASSEEKRESVKVDYDKIAEDYALEFGRKYEDFEVIEEFMSYLKSGAKILDLGGGTGKYTDLFLQKGYDAVCYDFSKEMMKKAKELYPNVPYLLDDIVHVKKHFSNETFDGILAFYSLFHIPKEEINQVFSNIYDLLKENGIFCFVVQLGEGEDFIDEPYLKEDGKNILYFHYFTKEQIDYFIQQHHFQKLYESMKEEVGENELGDLGNSKVFVIVKK